MKSILVTLNLLFVCVSWCQNYAPFQSDSPKRFLNPANPVNNTYFFYPIESSNNGDTTEFLQYRCKSTTLVDVTGTLCEGWGGYEQNTADTSWLGRYIRYNNLTAELQLRNANSELLTFDFGINLGDSALFYSSVAGDYYIRYDNLSTELVLAVPNPVKTFTIWKYDDLGTLVNSPLNGFQLKLSEQYGLVSFIECHQFPDLEQGVQLEGQLNPPLGNYALTYDQAFPWAPGDTLQTKGISYNGSWMVTAYNLITIQDRIETADSVWIYLQNEVDTIVSPSTVPQNLIHPYIIRYTSPIVFKKGTVLSEYPNEAIIYDETFYQGISQWCGDRSSYSFGHAYEIYCDSCDCFTPYDGAGGQNSHSGEYVAELGKTYAAMSVYGNWTSHYFSNLIYSHVGGITCGSFYALNTTELTLVNKRELIRIVDLLGREVEPAVNQVQLYMYSDGTTERVLRME